MNKERLLDVVEVLKGVPDDDLQMRYWWNECGSAGCAVGHYMANRPESQLKMDNTDGWPTFGNKLKGFDAVVAFFEIELGIAEFLFEHSSYRSSFGYGWGDPSRQQVIDRITAFVNGEAVPRA